jgi:hypothetical protein
MKPCKVDERRRLRLTMLSPGDYWELEVLDSDHLALRRVQAPWRPVKLTKAEALTVIEKSRLRFAQGWAQLKEETRT